ncbi:sialidase family protein [Prosthecobacter sp.]|uniref:sialidase family protein n=1 Tax=Prosthecobacter sp. TaxID=1965333 RepID=UPI003783FB13
MKCSILSILSALLIPCTREAAAADGDNAAPAATVVERAGITGAGWAVVAGEAGASRVTLVYPNHPDDFGGTAGTGASHSADGGRTWTQGPDDWPVAKCIDLWQDRMKDGSLAAFGIRWVPDPKKRGEQTGADVPADAYAIAVSKDQGRTWSTGVATLHCPPEMGIIARPLPHLLEDGKGAWLMPAYAWGKTGTRALLLRSADHGRNWSVLSTITTAAEMVKAGAAPTTPWLETAVARTADGALLAVIRTGSSEQAALVAARSADGGTTWSPVEKIVAGPQRQIVAGKLPSLLLMPNGTLVLLTAHTKLGCFLHLSHDGNGREWSAARVVTQVSGGNTCMTALDAETVLVFTPSSKRISCWKVALPAVSSARR